MKRAKHLCLILLWLFPLIAGAQQITVAAAASLQDAFKELAGTFEASHPHLMIRFNFGASGILLQQINQGAPVDVFASADQETMDRAQNLQLLDTSTRRNFVSNSLVLIEPIQATVHIQSLQDLKKPSIQKIAVGKPATVPAGHYAQQVLEVASLWQPLATKIIPSENVRQVLDYVARAEVDAGFVYRTDATHFSDRVRIVLTPAQSPILYPVAVTTDSKQKDLATAFIAYLLSAPAQQVLLRYGFGTP